MDYLINLPPYYYLFTICTIGIGLWGVQFYKRRMLFNKYIRLRISFAEGAAGQVVQHCKGAVLFHLEQDVPDYYSFHITHVQFNNSRITPKFYNQLAFNFPVGDQGMELSLQFRTDYTNEQLLAHSYQITVHGYLRGSNGKKTYVTQTLPLAKAYPTLTPSF